MNWGRYMVTLRKLSLVPPIKVGSVWDRLTVIGPAASYKNRYRQWQVRCSCGRQLVLMDQSIRSGATRSCGCLAIEMKAQTRVHGHSIEGRQTKTYMAWRDMLQRCYNEKNPSYHNYGGRGIKVCRRWWKFKNFLDDMGPAPEGLTLDRTEVNKGYSKTNCAWVTWEVQGEHRRFPRELNFEGTTKRLVDWAKDLGMKRETLRGRARKGWPVERILFAEVKKGPRKWE